MDAVVIPGWFLNTVAGLVGFGILSGLFLKYYRSRQIALRERETERKKQVRERAKLREEEEKDQAKLRKAEKAEILDRLLPGPWRTLYEFLQGWSGSTRQGVMLTAVSFKRDVDNIPKIFPYGFDLILGVSYYNLGGKGNCHEDFVIMFGEYVEFPKDYGRRRRITS